MKEPKTLTSAALLSAPFMVINAFISIGIIYIFSALSFYGSFFTEDSITITIHFGVIIGMILMIIIHEFFHLIFIPHFIKSDETYIGLKLFVGYVYTEQILTKERYILISLAPYVILSVLFPLFLCIFGLLTATLSVLIILNSMGSSLDILGVILLLFQVPKNAVMKTNGTRTYWKMER